MSKATVTAIFSVAGIFSVGLVVVLACASPLLARDDVPADVSAHENPASLDEKELRYYTRQFKGKCARCHGIGGTGKGESAAGQEVPPADFTDAAYMATRTDGDLYYQILMGGGDRCAMPAFGPESDHAWNDDKIWHMVAFVRRFAVPASD